MKSPIYLLSLLVLLILSSCSTKYYIVRHAEKECEDCLTCGLSAEGNKRAMALRDMLISHKIDTIITSQCLRTQYTAMPLAMDLELQIGQYETTLLDTFMSFIPQIKNKKRILIVSHSNQAPAIVEFLSGKKVSMGSDEYHTLFIVTHTTSGRFRNLKVKHYGLH